MSFPKSSLFCRRFIAFLTVFLAIVTVGWGNTPRPVVYVDASAPTGGDGTSWGTAYKQLRDVLPSVASGSDIWIAAGTYKPSASNSKTAYFTINSKDLRLFGGFIGNETSLNQRNLSANETILSGDYSGNDGAIYNSSTFSDNAYHVFVITDSNVTMDGLTIKGGNARVTSSDQDSGGGIRAQTNTILNINNCSVESNYAVSYGGGIATFTGTKLNFSNSILQNNYNGFNGGAGLSLWGGVHSFHNSIFYNNDGSQVGAVLVHTGGTSFNNCLFVNNDGWSRRWAGGGALHLRSASTINNCTFYNNNFADTSSGGDLDFSSTVTVSNSIFWHPTKSANLLGASGTLVMSNSIVRGGASGTSVSTQNPLFLNTSNIKGADGKWFTNDDGFQLSASSPAKSAGLLSAILSDVFDIDADGNITEASPLDLAGNPRPYGAALDLGAYEYLDPNTAPSDLNSTVILTIAENQPVGTVVGEFNATDPDAGAVLIYHLVSGAGDAHNSLFNLETNGTLKTATTFDYETNASTYFIRVQAKDEHNASVEGNFTVMLTDQLNEGPPIQVDGNSTEVKTTGTVNGTNWVKKKTIVLPQQTLVNEVRNEIKNDSTKSAWFTECKIKFFYSDGSSLESTIQTHTSNYYLSKTYLNPDQLKEVSSVEVWLRQNTSGNDKEAWERNTILYGYSNNATNTVPVFSSGGGLSSYSLVVLENDRNVTTVSASDPEGLGISYTITGGSDSTKFSLNSGTGKLIFVHTPNFEYPRDSGADNQYEVVVRASDGALYSEQTILITVSDLNEDSKVAMNLSETKTVSETDGTNLTKKKTLQVGNRMVTQVENEIKNEHSSGSTTGCKMKFIYSDGNSTFGGLKTEGNREYAKKVYLNPQPSKSVATIEVWLNTSNGSSNKEGFERNTIVYGTLITSVQVDQNSSNVSTDFGSDGIDWVRKKTIHLGGRNISEVTNEIKNASTSSLWITESKIIFFYQDGSWDSSSVESHSSNSFVQKSYANPCLFKAVDKIEVWLRQSHGGNDKKAYEANTLVFGLNNYLPADLNSTALLTIAENQPVGTVVGEFNATDPDAGATLTYHLVSGAGDGNNSLFTLETNGTLKTATTFDYETNASTYSIRVQAKDEYNATVEGNFTVILIDVIELAPQTITWSQNLSSVSYGMADLVLTASASSGLPVSYSSSDSSIVEINGTRLIVVGSGSATVTASQSGNGQWSAALSVDKNVTVTKANQEIRTLAGSLSLPNFNKDSGDFVFGGHLHAVKQGTNAPTGLAISYGSSDPLVVQVVSAGTKLKVSGGGTATITASQAGSSGYNAAATKTFTVTVSEYSPYGDSIPGMMLWLDAMDVNGDGLAETASDFLNVGGKTQVNSWADRSGSNNSLHQANAAKQPVYLIEGGLPVLAFGGTQGNSGAYMTGSMPSSLSGNVGFTMVVAMAASGTGPDRVFSFGTPTGTGGQIIGLGRDGGFYFNNAQTLFNSSLNAPVQIGVFRRKAGSTYGESEFTLNGTKLVGYGISGTPNLPVSGGEMLLGAGRNSAGTLANHLNAKVHEIMLFSDSLGDYGLSRVEGYLAYKWGASSRLASGHPFKNQRPLFGGDQNITVAANNLTVDPNDNMARVSLFDEPFALEGSYATSGLNIVYESNNSSVLQVDSNGLLRPMAEGTVRITLRQPGDSHFSAASNNVFDLKIVSNDTPSNLTAVASLTVAENQSIGTIVGEFNATDPDAGATLTYHLVTGAGDGNNSLFTLETNGTLKTATTFDYETNASTYTIRVQAKDEFNATVEGNFTVTVQSENWFHSISGLSGMHRLDLAVSEQNRFALVGGQSSGGFADVVEYPSFQLSWNFRVNTSTQTWVEGVSFDASGNTYLGGHIGASDTFGGLNVPFQYERDPWIGKVDSNGNWQWVRSVGTSGWSGTQAVATDAQGNSYVTGFIYGSATFGSTTMGGAGWYDAFLAKIDTNGNWLWAKSVGGSSSDFGRAVCVDDQGNVYWTGDFVGSVNIGGTTLTSNGGGNLNGGGEVFAAKLDSNGNYLWAVSAGSSSGEQPFDITADSDGNAYLACRVSGVPTFGSIIPPFQGGLDGVVAKINSQGQWVWAKSIAGVGGDASTGIALGANNRLYVSGSIGGVASFDGQNPFGANGVNQAYVAELDTNGNLLDLALFQNLSIGDVVSSQSGDTLIGGTFSGAVHYFGASYQPSGSSDLFVALYQSGSSLNTPPSNLSTVTPLTIAENQPIGTVVGDFNATDPDAGANLTYHLVSGAGDGNNSLFTFETNGTLKTATTFDFETNASTYSIRVQAKDEFNSTVEGNFTVTLINENEPSTGTVTVSGTPVVGQTLTASNSLADADGLGAISYQWYRDGVPIVLGSTLQDGNGSVDGLDKATYVLCSPDNKHVYVLGFGDDSVSVYERNATTGELSFKSLLKDGVNGVNGLDGPRNIVLSADGEFAFVAGGEDDSISWYDRNTSTGTLSYLGILKDGVGGVDGLNGPHNIVLSKDSRHAYVTGWNDNAVSWYEVNATSGALTFLGALKDGVNGLDGLSSAYDVALSPNGEHAYVTSAGDDSVSWYDRDNVTGDLSFVGMLKDQVNGADGLDGARSIVLTSDGKFAYLAAATDHSLGWFDRNASSGALTFLGILKDGVNGVEGLQNASHFILSHDEKQVYVVGWGGNAVSWYDRNATSGGLDFGGILKDGVDGVDGLATPSSISLSADGRSAYVTSWGEDALSDFTRESQSGSLSYGVASGSNYTLSEADLGKTITVVASYRDGGGYDHNISSTGSPVVQPDNSAPTHVSTTAPLTIAENQPVGTVVGEFNATDPDAGATLTYHLVSGAWDTHNTLFTLETNGTLKNATVFDYESNASTYSIRVQAKDEFNATVEGNFTVTLTDVYEDSSGQSNNDGNSSSDGNTTTGITNPGVDGNSSYEGNASVPSPVPNYFRPIVDTLPVGEVNGTTVKLRGSLMDTGGLATTEFGFLLSSRPNPMEQGSGVIRLAAESNASSFSAVAADLMAGKTYYFRAFAVNAEGIGYGFEESFETPAGSRRPTWIEAVPGTVKGWWTSPWLGNFYLNANGWARHEKLGWVFPVQSSTAGLWLWKEGFGWLWTGEAVYPFLYRNVSGGWLYFYGRREETLLFYDYSTKDWIIRRDGQ